ncbi:MAG: metallophosphoesterase family protein [Firmicutes bacterium]|nr:metallophosphoesterase family protein [Bacillota bacterium]
MTKVGVISDTHGILRPEMLRVLQSCDKIIHAGDFASERVAKELDRIAPMYMVRGNNDLFIPAGQLETLRFSIEEVNFFVIHNRYHISEIPPETDIVVHGHTHVYSEEKRNGVLWLNPGSAWMARGWSPPSMAVLTIDGKDYGIRKVLL